MTRRQRVGLAVLTIACLVLGASAQAVPGPGEYLGIAVGADRVLVSVDEMDRYLRALAAASDRVELVEVGQTVAGRPMLAAVVSAPGNIERLGELRRAWARVADPRTVPPGGNVDLIGDFPSLALITAGIHSTEVAGTPAALLFTHRLAAAPEDTPEFQWLQDTVVLVIPSLNPYGQDKVVEWYRRWLDTPHEGSSIPFLYHPYAGHDNNRDFLFLNLPESRALNRLVSLEWRPQLFLDLHQMGSQGPRQFVPPFADPIAPRVHPLIWRMTSHLGTAMALELESRGKTGVISGWVFDGAWIGGTRNTAWWKNIIGVLTETASAALASPVHVDASELRGGGKGLVEYRQQANFPSPWPGGTWRHADAVEYQLGVMSAFVRFAAQYRKEVLRGVSQMADTAIRRGNEEPPRAWVVPAGQADPGRVRRLVELLLEAGAEARLAAEELTAGETRFPAGSVVFPAAQPLRQYLYEVLERQRYPEVTPAPGAGILLPYDVTAWTMPLMLGVLVARVEEPIKGRTSPLPQDGSWLRPPVTGRGSVVAVPADQHGAFAAVSEAMASGAAVSRLTAEYSDGGTLLKPGSFILEGIGASAAERLQRRAGAGAVRLARSPDARRPLRAVRVGVYHPNYGLRDAGWIRLVLEQAGLAVEVVDSETLAGGELRQSLDVLVIPPMPGQVIVDGPRVRGAVPMPPEYRRGIGAEGVSAVRRFVNQGGTAVGFQASAEWLAAALDIELENELQGLGRDTFHCPGALLTLELDRDHPISWGMPGRVAAMVAGAHGFRTRPAPAGQPARKVPGRFPDEELLLSGWLRGEELLRRRAAVIEAPVGDGKAVLFSFAPYFRAQTRATLPLLLNTVFNAGLDQTAPIPEEQPARRVPGV